MTDKPLESMTLDEIEAEKTKAQQELDGILEALGTLSNQIHDLNKQIFEADTKKRGLEMEKREMLNHKDRARIGRDRLENRLNILNSAFWNRRRDSGL